MPLSQSELLLQCHALSGLRMAASLTCGHCASCLDVSLSCGMYLQCLWLSLRKS